MIARPGDVIPPGYLNSLLNMTANKMGFIESRRGSAIVGSNLANPVHSQGRILINGTAYRYQGAGSSLYREWILIASGLTGDPLTFREGGPDTGILPQEIAFDANARYKDNGSTVTGFGIAGPMAAASAVAAAATTKTIDLFEYANDAAIQAAWPTTSATITTTTTSPAQGTYAGNLAVAASTTGYATRTVALNLNQFSAAGDSDDEDWIALYLRVDLPSNIEEFRLMFDVDPATNDFAHNYYWKAVAPNVLTPAVAGTQTANQGTGALVTNLPLRLEGIDNTDPRFEEIPPVELSTGINQWIQIFVKKSEFTRVGTSANNWANVAAVRIQVQTKAGATVNLGIDGLAMQGSTTARLDGTDYLWVYRYENEATQTVSPFSPEMIPAVNTDGTTISKTKATVTVRNPRDTQATHIQLYRKGGDTSEYAFALRQAVTAWTATVNLTDGLPDSSLGAVADMTQVELANLAQTPSQTCTSFRKTTNNGAAFTDYTSAVSDDDQTTYANLNALNTLAANNWVVIGADQPFRQILVVMDGSFNGNTSTLTLQYWDGAVWRTVLNMSDGTSVDSKTLRRGGTIKFDFPVNWQANTLDGVKAYYIRWTVSAQLSAAVHITEARVGANAFDPTTCDIAGGRIWVDDSSHKDRVWYSQRFALECFDEDNFVVAAAGGDPVVRPFALDDQVFVFTKKTINRIIGSSSDSFQAIPTGSESGLFSKYAICRGQGRIFYRFYDGIYALPASGFPDKVSLAIDPIFHGYPSEDLLLLPVDNNYASTETLEFFDTKIMFGYTDTSGVRRELQYDLETDRWEPSDRPVSSYLRLDDLGVYYSGHTDGYVYVRETGNQDNGQNIATRFRTQYMDMGVPTQDKSIVAISLDADLGGASVTIYADLNNGAMTAQSATVTNSARGILHFPIADDTEVRNIAFRMQSTNGGVLVKFYKVTIFYIVRPSPLTKVLTDWDDLGYAGDKRLRQLQLDIDTKGVDATVVVQVDGAAVQTMTVNTAGRQVVERSVTADTIGRLVRLVITSASPVSYYRHQFEFIRDPLNTTRYDTFELDFGWTRWKFIRRMWLAVRTPATVTVEIWVDEVKRYTTTVYIESLSGWSKYELLLPPGLKGKVFRFIFTSTTAFKIFLDQSDVEWHPLASDRGYARAVLTRTP